MLILSRRISIYPGILVTEHGSWYVLYFWKVARMLIDSIFFGLYLLQFGLLICLLSVSQSFMSKVCNVLFKAGVWYCKQGMATTESLVDSNSGGVAWVTTSWAAIAQSVITFVCFLCALGFEFCPATLSPGSLQGETFTNVGSLPSLITSNMC